MILRCLAAAALLAPSALSFAEIGAKRLFQGTLPPNSSTQRLLRAPAERDLLGAVCRSPFPVVVLDNFASPNLAPYIDVDGDGTPDVAHGDLVAAIYKASGKRTINLDMRGDGDVGTLATLLEPIADQLESGGLKIAAVNISQMATVSLDAVARDTNLPFTSNDFLSQKSRFNDALIRAMDAQGARGYGRLSRVLERIRRLEVPVLVAAGNEGHGRVNLLSFLPGTTSVGALAEDGSRLSISADNALATSWRLGEFRLRRAPAAERGVRLARTGEASTRFIGTSFAASAVCLGR